MRLQPSHLLLALCLSSTTVLAKHKEKDKHGLKADCKNVNQGDDCPDGKVEIYQENGKSTCCKPGSKGALYAYNSATECQTTQCTRPKDLPADKCSTTDDAARITPVSVNGSSLVFEKMMEEECKTDGGHRGLDVVCCPVGSSEVALQTLLAAEHHQFPHNVYLSAGGGLCGGTIYNERYIITASHCLVDKKADPDEDGKLPAKSVDDVTSYLGSDIAWEGEQYKTEKIHIYPDSTLRIPGHKKTVNDIAIIKVDRDIKFGPNVKALPIANKGLKPLDYADHAIIVGFGDTDTLVTSRNLKRGNTLLRSSEKNLGKGGHQHRKYGMKYADKFLFVGGVQDGKASVSTGKGDSGGPAICRDENGIATLCGLNSFGGAVDTCEKYKDEQNCQPKVFVRVSHFHDWITSIAGDQSNADVMIQPLYGKKVDQGKYDHQVHITSKEGESCGGTLISKDTVLTAAHCVAKDDGSQKSGLKVMTGVRDLDNTSGGSASYDVSSVKVLEGFERVGGKRNNRPGRIAVYAVKPSSQDSFFKNDLAVVKLKGTADISNIPNLASSNPTQDGTTWSTEVALPLKVEKQRDLSSREFNLLEHDECQTRMDRLRAAGYTVTVDENVMCGEEKYTGGSLCDRELGGGLICPGDNGGEEVLCGVQTFRMCDFAIPSAFLNVASYKDWIQQQI